MLINLLPWREELRQSKQRQFIRILIISLISAIVLFSALNIGFDYFLHYQKQQSAALKQRLSQLDTQLKNIQSLQKQIQYLTSRLRELDKLHLQSIQRVQMFEALPHIISGNLLLTELRCVNGELIANGLADSSAEITLFIHHLLSVKGIQHPMLSEMNAATDNGLYRYAFTVKAGVA